MNLTRIIELWQCADCGAACETEMACDCTYPRGNVARRDFVAVDALLSDEAIEAARGPFTNQERSGDIVRDSIQAAVDAVTGKDSPC